MRRMSNGGRKLVMIGLVVVGLALAGIGIAYFTIPAKDLPSFLPGKPSYCTDNVATTRCKILIEQHGFNDKKLVKRGVAVEIVAVLSFVGAWYVARPKRSSDASPQAAVG